MAKSILLSLFLSMVSLALSGQMKPGWTSAAMRELDFPQRFFFTGYIEGNVRQGETVENAKQRLLRDAQGLLSEGIRVTVRSETASRTVSTTTNRNERIESVFAADVQTNSEVEIVGIYSETPYYDPETGIVHAFAYVSRHELTGYYRANLNMNLTQAEGLLQTAHDLEAAGEKGKSLSQCQEAMSLLVRARQLQDMLTALDANSTSESLQQPRTETLHSRLVQMLARLAQAVHVYVESTERNFTIQATLLGNRLKSELAAIGCGFVNDPAEADFRLNILATTRYHGVEYGLTVCYADVTVSLFDVRRNISVFAEEFSQKGISNSREAAGRRALEDAAPAVSKKISQWIE